MDNLLIHTKDTESLKDHQCKDHLVLDRLAQHNLYLKPSKCEFKQSQVEFLGLIISHNSIAMDPKKLQGIADWSPPKDVTGIRRFLSFTGFYHHFVPGYLSIIRPLLSLTKKAATWHWGPLQHKVFKTLKTLMCSKPVLHQPNFSKCFYIQTDASAYGMGAILSQEGDSQVDLTKGTMPKLHPLAYYSCTFTPTQQKYDIYERELLAVFKALDHWQAYLAWGNQQLVVLTDHANLTYWKHPQKLNDRTARWHAKLQDYNFIIVHVQGTSNSAADALSRTDETP
jgi:hypothetical protein